MKTKHKIQIIFFLLATFILTIFTMHLIFNKEPYRQQEYLEKKQRVILPFKQLKDKYQ